jgi:hypothetical protein
LNYYYRNNAMPPRGSKNRTRLPRKSMKKILMHSCYTNKPSFLTGHKIAEKTLVMGNYKRRSFENKLTT